MARPKFFLELRQALERAGYDQKLLAARIKRSESYVSCRFRGLNEWDLEDIYRIMEVLRLSQDQIPVLFPRSGGFVRKGTASIKILDRKEARA